jgi:methionyl-tRNA formyltransferase
MKLVFLGTPEIAVPSLEFFINKEDIEVLAVVTQPDKPAGRGHKLTAPPVKVIAEQFGIKVYQPIFIRKDLELISILKELKPDFFITVAFGQILSQEILDIPKIGTINMHASLLPKYRGANPIQWAIINGDKVTGITTMLTDIGVDTGPMLLKKEIEITENMNAVELAEIISKTGPQLLYDSMTGLVNKTVIPIPQNHEEATHAPKLKKEDGKINWQDSALNIHNKVRGMKPFPGTYTFYKDDQIKILETAIETRMQKKSIFSASLQIQLRPGPPLDQGCAWTSPFQGRERKNPKFCKNLNFSVPSIPNNKENIEKGEIGEILGIIDNNIRVLTGNGILLVKKLQPLCKKPVEGGCWCNGVRIQKRDKFI